MINGNKIAVQMLVGQYEEPFLPYAIRSVIDWVDYFTVVNTAPGTKHGEHNKATVFKEIPVAKLRYREIHNKDGLVDFAAARNTCIEETDFGDFILILDSDDVHYPELEDVLKEAFAMGVDRLTAHFYHLMVYKNIFQYVQPREILYKNNPGTQWIKGVHEQLISTALFPATSDYHYVHYGYIKSQEEVFKRWKMYSDIEGDSHHYDGQNPEHILDDRISVSKPMPIGHPPAIRQFLESYPECPPLALRISRETVPVEKVGLVLLTYNDEQYLSQCLSTLARTHTFPNFEVFALDMGSTDLTQKVLSSYEDLIEMQVWEYSELLSLTKALNIAFDHFRVRHDIQYIGWIHPDMEFPNPDWLFNLWKELERYPRIGKICASNLRDQIPQTLIHGHEQCYIIRKDIVNKIGLFDEGFTGIGGYEDWDYNKRILNHDLYKVMTTPRSLMMHHGMGTRSKRDTTDDQIHNAMYYTKKWGSNVCPV